ncbi:hypothetical protein J3495_11885 [Flavobacterium sp. P7388]|uniref:Uncharacterized protein n=1 Tax=Flavobacterium geliluteum TaxID=2816120 RepID=A0A940XFH4_9FLAO|nr:hypothetical protein [Flavobacterium geliluteum]
MRLFFVNLGYALLLLNFILYALHYSKQTKVYKIFTGYIFVIVCVQIATYTCFRLYNNNLFLSHFYFIGQFIMLSLFYSKLVKGDFQKKVIRIGLILVLSTLVIQYTVKPELFLKFNLYEIFITSFLIIIYATFHFYNMLDEKKEFYFINMGVIMYLFGSTILFLVGNLTTNFSAKFSFITWTLNVVLYAIYQLFILYEWKVSFSKSKKEKVLE